MRRSIFLLLLVVGCASTRSLGPVDRSRLPEPKPTPAWGPPVVAKSALKNGMSLWHLEQRQAPLVSLRVVFPHGGATDPQGKAGLTSLMADMLDEGAGDRSALELSDALQRLATDYFAYTTTDGLIIGMDMLADNVDASIAILADILRRPRFDAKEFERRKAERIAEALAGEANPDVGRANVLRRALFGTGYASAPPRGTRPSLEGISLEEVRAQYTALVEPASAAVVVVGALEAQEAKRILAQHFGDWSGSPTVHAAGVWSGPPKPGIYIVDYPGAPQTGISVVSRAAGRDAPDYFAAEVFSWVLGGAFTSRLNLNLREDKGYTYGARAWFNRFGAAGYFSLNAKVETDTTRASIDEMLAELRGSAGERPLTESEHRDAVGGLQLGFPQRFERIASIAGQITELPLYGRAPDWFATWSDAIGKVTLEETNEAARRASDVSRFVIVLAGDREAIEPSLKTLDLPVFVYDATGEAL